MADRSLNRRALRCAQRLIDMNDRIDKVGHLTLEEVQEFRSVIAELKACDARGFEMTPGLLNAALSRLAVIERALEAGYGRSR